MNAGSEKNSMVLQLNKMKQNQITYYCVAVFIWVFVRTLATSEFHFSLQQFDDRHPWAAAVSMPVRSACPPAPAELIVSFPRWIEVYAIYSACDPMYLNEKKIHLLTISNAHEIMHWSLRTHSIVESKLWPLTMSWVKQLNNLNLGKSPFIFSSMLCNVITMYSFNVYT